MAFAGLLLAVVGVAAERRGYLARLGFVPAGGAEDRKEKAFLAKAPRSQRRTAHQTLFSWLAGGDVVARQAERPTGGFEVHLLNLRVVPGFGGVAEGRIEDPPFAVHFGPGDWKILVVR